MPLHHFRLYTSQAGVSPKDIYIQSNIKGLFKVPWIGMMITILSVVTSLLRRCSWVHSAVASGTRYTVLELDGAVLRLLSSAATSLWNKFSKGVKINPKVTYWPCKYGASVTRYAHTSTFLIAAITVESSAGEASFVYRGIQTSQYKESCNKSHWETSNQLNSRQIKWNVGFCWEGKRATLTDRTQL